MEIQLSDYIGKMYDNAAMTRKFAALLAETHLPPSRVDRMQKCCTLTTGRYCPDCKTFHTEQTNRCRDRLCPNCGWALARERARTVTAAINKLAERHPDMVALHIMLSIQHGSSIDGLSSKIDRLISGFRSLLRMQPFSTLCIGTVRNIEILNDNGGYHPHIHALVFMRPEYWHSIIPQDTLCHMWRRAIKADYKPITWIARLYDKDAPDDRSDIRKAVYEAVKYTIKTQQLLSLPASDLETLAAAVANKHLFAITGAELKSLYKAIDTKRQASESLASELCPSCGDRLRRITIDFDKDMTPTIHTTQFRHTIPKLSYTEA